MFDELGIFWADLFVNKCTVLLAAGLGRDALTEVDAALARIERDHGSATRRAELLYSSALAAAATGDLGLAQERSAEAMRRSAGSSARGGQRGPSLSSCGASSRGGQARSAALLRAARRVTARLDELDPARAVEAHLLTGRIALARGRRDEAGPHLQVRRRRRHRGPPRTRSTGWVAQAIWCEAEGRWRGMLAACDRGLAMLDLHLPPLGATAAHAGHRRRRGACRHGPAPRRAPRRRPAVPGMERALAWHRAPRLARPPTCGQRAEGRTGRPPQHRDPPGQRPLDSRAGAPTLERERRRLETAVRQRVLRTPAVAAAQAEAFRTADLVGQLGDTDLLELTDVDGQLPRRGRHRRPAAPGARRPDPGAATHALAHALFALRREGAGGCCTHRLDLTEIGRRLEMNLLGESVHLLRDGPLVVVPTGKLHAVPWGMLPSLRDRPAAVTPSASAWLRARHAFRPDEDRVVLIGGPRLLTGDAEVRALTGQYPDATVLADGDATADRVMAAIDGAWLVHMAAHGTFRDDSPLFSAIELADGPLTVYDLERLKQAPYHVVLSSCSSAVGVAVGADELPGLVSALISLGSAGSYRQRRPGQRSRHRPPDDRPA